MYLSLFSLILTLFGTTVAHSQVTPDGTLSTTVTQSGNSFTIDNGTQVGSNLFHSFSQFSLPTGGAVIFNNAANVQNIFSRITGGTVSNIDGLIQANGTANLFLLNPNGILFGPNASLNIGGSFIGTTANSIQFADGTEFSAVNPTASPLLTIAVPIGLQMGQSPGAISVRGTGHRLAAASSLVDPYFPYAPYGGLQVLPNRTLALIGGNINLSGGVLQAPSGNIEIGSLAQSALVPLQGTDQGFSANYAGITGFGAIDLTKRASIETRGLSPGTIQIQGGRVNIQAGSLISGTNFSPLSTGAITVSAAQSLTVSGENPAFNVLTGIVEDNFGTGRGGKIVIQTPDLLIQSGGSIFSRNYGSGPGGAVTLNADNIQVVGYATTAPDVFSRVGTLTTAAGKGGDVFVSTQALSLQASAFIGSTTLLGGSRGGDVLVNADTVHVEGISPANISSILGATNVSRVGQSGNLTVNTRTLAAKNGGVLVTSSISSGKAGNLLVNASESIEVNGYSNLDANSSAISSAVVLPDPIYQQLFGISGVPSADSGDVIVNAPSLNISNYGAVSVANYGIGKAGLLSIQAGKLLIKDGAYIGAFTLSGDGGDITIQSNQIVMINDATIGTTAFGQDNTGNGGNINITADVIVGVQNSDIRADASRGSGGNINITTQGIFGLKYRPLQTSDNDINASSEFGVSGTVQINNLSADPDAGLLTLPANVTDTSQQLAKGCIVNEADSFIVTGRGGIPQNPTQEVRSDRPWGDLRDLSAFRKSGNPVAQIPVIPAPVPTLKPATGWRHHANGTVELIAAQSAAAPSPVATCSGAGIANARFDR